MYWQPVSTIIIRPEKIMGHHPPMYQLCVSSAIIDCDTLKASAKGMLKGTATSKSSTAKAKTKAKKKGGETST